MGQKLTKISGVLALLTFFLACSADLEKVNDEDDRNQMSEKVIQVPPEDYLAINEVLKRWREGYEIEDIETYMNAYWSQGFRYVSDMGTDGDKTDDLLFDDIREERDAAIRVFSQFQNINIALTVPPEITVIAENKRVEVRNHYRIQGFVPDGESFEGEFTGWYAEGDNLFIFEKRDGDWRISEWHDEAFSEEEIHIENNQLLPIVWTTLKQPR
ncbi:MAG: hypothetical protein OXM61_14840 [Candidatus Poribacteria bacterium]|nr:hypothetical protein [Candidatus Poribacteria bacterium]